MENKKLETVRKLLAMAADESLTPEARESYMDKASDLMVKYGIEDAHLAASGKSNDEIVNHYIPVQGTFAKELSYLIVGAAAAMGNLVPYTAAGYGSTIKVHIVGYRSEVERAELLATSLLMQQKTALHNWWLKRKNDFKKSYGRGPSGTESYKLRRSFLTGFAVIVAERIQARRAQVVKEETATSPGTDLVLVNREEQVQRWAKDNLRLRSAPSRRQYLHNGMNAGAAAGAQANIGGSELGDSKKEISS